MELVEQPDRAVLIARGDCGEDAAEEIANEGDALASPVGIERGESARIYEDPRVGLDLHVHEVELRLRQPEVELFRNAGHALPLGRCPRVLRSQDSRLSRCSVSDTGREAACRGSSLLALQGHSRGAGAFQLCRVPR